MFSPKTGIRFLTLDQTEKFLTERLPVTNLSQAASTIQLHVICIATSPQAQS